MCEKHNLVQLHLHTSASMLDGVNIPEKIIKKAKEYGHPAIAITDHGNPSNLFTFYKAAKKNGIKPILGLEFYINNDLRSRIPNRDRSLEERDYHQSIYIKNKEGYRNFCELTFRSFTEGYYYKPRIDFDSLFELSDGLMATSSCMASKTSQYIRSNRHKEAEEIFLKFRNKFGDDFVGEIQLNEVEGQKEINDYIIHLCNKYDVPLIIGGDVHYLNPEDNELQDAIIRSKRNTTAKTEDGKDNDWVINARNLYYHQDSDYFRFNKEFGFNYDEKLITKCFENSIKFAEKPNFEFETGKYHLPKIKTEGMTSDDYLDKLTWEGIGKIIETRRELGEVFSDELISKYEERLTYELSVIKKMGISDYLLIVQDIINWEKRNGFYVGVGRGSCAGSAVCYAIGITGIDPVQRGLIFERFINPERIVFPDIDWDSEQGARDYILNYLVDTYGQESVCNVATFGLFGAKSGLQDMSRGLGKDTSHESILMRKISKIDGLDKATDLHKFFEVVRNTTTDKEIIEWLNDNVQTIDFAQKMMGQMRQLGVHAGGILVTPGPVYDFIPVTKGNGNLISAFQEADGSSKDLSELGLMKLDVLGLKTLNVLKECVQNIKNDTGLDLTDKIENLRLGNVDDENLIKAFATGNNHGIFQMDRSKMFTSRIKVDSFDDIVAINAMNRPGPLEKFLDKYGYWKQIDKGEIEVSQEELERVNKERYPFPFMEKVLSKTYGCLHEDELIYNPINGYFETIKNIKTGDKVISYSVNEKAYKLDTNNFLIDNGKKEVFNYILKTGYELKVTADHKINTVYGEMEINNAFINKIPILLPKTLNVIDKQKLTTYGKARIIGLLLGDGSIKSTNIGLTNTNQVILNDFENLIKTEFPECKTYRTKKANRENVYFVNVTGKVKRKNNLNEFLNELKIKGCGSRNKFIPKIFFKCTDEIKLNLLGGLWDSDGSVNKYQAYYRTTSKNLAHDIITITRQLGMLPILRNNKNVYTVILRNTDFENIKPYILTDYKKELIGENKTYFNCIDKNHINTLIKNNGYTIRGFFRKYNLNRKSRGNFYNSVLLNKINEILKIEELENNYSIEITKKENLGINQVYDLNIKENPWFIAGYGGILVHNCLLYQEQFMFLVEEIAGINLGEADNFRRGIAWLPDNPKYHTISKYFAQLEKGMQEKGYSKEDTELFVNFCRDFMGYSFNLAHAECYAYIAYQTLFFKTYYPAYFYAAMINNEDKIDKFQEIIADARKHKIEIKSHSINKSRYPTTVENGNTIRLGYNMIKGMGGAVEDELKVLNLHECKTLDEVLQKPFKKINTTMLQNLINLGCFDDFGIDRGKIETLKDLYQDTKIATWYTRTKQKLRRETMPSSLEKHFDPIIVLKTAMKTITEPNPHIVLINKLIDEIKTKKVSPESIAKKTEKTQKELIGFSLVKNPQLAKFEAAFSLKGILPLRDLEINPNAEFYFSVVKMVIKQAKNGRDYLELFVNDGIGDYKVRCWSILDLDEGEAYYGKFKKDDFGITLIDRGVKKI